MIVIKINTDIIKIVALIVVLRVLIWPMNTGAQMTSDNFQVDKDVVGSFGDTASSSAFTLGDTGGEAATGVSASDNFSLEEAGFWDQNELYTISINAADSVTMSAITGTGKSQWTGSENDAYCNVKTNNPFGYELTWQASSADMTNANNDAISAYTPEGMLPEAWNVDVNDSEWGAKLMSTSDVYDQGKWGTEDTYADGKWLNVNNTVPYQVTATYESTPETGDNEYLRFGAEIGSNKFQPPGTYAVNVTLTATTL